MTSYTLDDRIQGTVLDSKPGRPAAALVGMVLTAALRKHAERAEMRGESIAWPTLQVTSGYDAANLLLHVEVQAGIEPESAPTRPAAGSGMLSELLAVQAELAGVRASLAAAGRQLDAAAAMVRTQTPTPFLRQLYVVLTDDAPKPSGEEARSAQLGETRA